MYFSDLPEFKFSKKNFKEKIETNIELRTSFMKCLHELLVSYLSDTKVVDADEGMVSTSMIDIFNSFNDEIPE